MLKQFFYAIFLMAPGLCYAGSSVETFFESLVGKWHGEVPGIYKADIIFNPMDTKKPWVLQTGQVDILEGGEKFNYQFELSKNESGLDNEAVYFLKVTNLINKESEIFTLASRELTSSPLSFWRHFIVKSADTEYTSANAIKLFVEDGALTWGFVSGNGYCKDSKDTAPCASDGYTPYLLKKTK